VLNVLQWVTADTSRFTVEGEGIEGWCCPKAVLYEQTIAAEGVGRLAAGIPRRIG